ncbi:MbeD/MobD family mobilization/exclusion protein [Shigella boydii]
MTELERHLLNALEQLQQDYMQRLNEPPRVSWRVFYL